MTTFNGHCIVVAVVRCIGDLICRNALNDLSVQSDDKIAADLIFSGVLEAFKIIPIILCGTSWISRIMNHHTTHSIGCNPWSGVFVDSQKLHIKLRLWNLFYRISDIILLPCIHPCLLVCHFFRTGVPVKEKDKKQYQNNCCQNHRYGDSFLNLPFPLCHFSSASVVLPHICLQCKMR